MILLHQTSCLGLLFVFDGNALFLLRNTITTDQSRFLELHKR